MKIAYISFTSFSDCDIPFINELIKQGVDVKYYLIMSDRTKKGAVINVDALKNSCGIFQASDYPTLAGLSKYIDLSIVRVANMKITHNYAPSSFLLAYKLRKELKTEKFDLIHLAWPVDYPFYQIYTLHIPFVLTVHDPIPHSNDERFKQKFKRYAAFKRADKFILLNKTQKEDFEKRYGIDDSSVEMSRLSIYTHLQSTPTGEPLVEGSYILFIGTILPYKGIKYIVQAMSEINQKHPDVKLVIAGRGEFDFDIQSYMNDGKIILINRFITNEELSSLIHYSKFVCCPYTDATQSGVVMSAFALNKPVLATKVGALHETIENGKHGILVPPCNSTALAEAVDTMLSDGTLAYMTENIKQDFSEGEKSWKSVAQKTIDIYKKLINKK